MDNLHKKRPSAKKKRLTREEKKAVVRGVGNALRNRMRKRGFPELSVLYVTAGLRKQAESTLP